MSNRIRELRKKAGMTQTQLAKAVGTELTQMGKLERGERTLSLDWINRLAKALGCDPRDLIGEDDGDEDSGAEMVPLPSSESLSAMLRVYLSEKAPDRTASQELVDDLIARLSPRLIDTLRILQEAPAAASDPQAARLLALGITARRDPQK